MTEEKDTQIPETEIPLPEDDMADAADAQNDGTGDKGKKEKKADIKKLRAELEALKKSLEEEKAKGAEATDKYLRICAEYDNFRKRTQKEKENTYGEAVADTIKGLLPIIDNLQYASKYGNADSEKFAEGVKLILDKLPEDLAKMQITPVGAVGETFDPELHNAVMHTEDETCGENEIVEVLQSGYKYQDKVIRYAMVKVAN